MDTKYLNYILTIAKKQNMTKAAEELYVSQSSLSQYLSKLENEIGTPLFYRSKGSLTLTPAGQLYIKAAEQVVQIKDQLYRSIQNLDNRGHITIGVTSQFGLKMLTELIPPFKAEYPDVTIEISETNVPTLTKMLQEENIDCGIMALNIIEPFSPNQVDVLRQEEVFLAIPKTHPYYQKNPERPVTIQDFSENFSEDNVLLAKKGSTLRFLTDQLIEEAHIMLSTICETNSVTATRSMVAMGIGVTLIGESCAKDREHIAYYPLDPPIYRLNAFVRRKNWTMNGPENHLRERIVGYF
ncbi:MAG: LysR family transcriptional regulator [Lachnospiraceae bacterium]|nr:LysR family transcriptional regulator [Lachnospiraceae bacterium]